MIAARAAVFAALALILGHASAADDAGPRDPKGFDKLVVDTLRDVHNKGADLYNTTKDYVGTFRMYEGSLRTVRPLLAHRPDAQKIIDEGLEATDKEADVARRAFMLHETIENVRAYLKTGAVPASKGTETPPLPKPMTTPEPKVNPTPPPPKPMTTPEPKVNPTPPPKPKTLEVRPGDKVEVTPIKPRAGGTTGKVTFGKPAAKVDVILVSLDLAKPRVFTATTKDDGSYTIAETVPDGKYVVVVTGKDVPAKYSTTTTSGVVIEVKSGAAAEIVLK